MEKNPEKIKKMIREGYAKAIQKNTGCCSSGSCCGSVSQPRTISEKVGYSDAEMNAVPEGANLGFGCGNPVAMASLQEGDVAVDLGSGAGFDAFLAAQKVGKKGRVIGIDMTPEMIEKARGNAQKGGYANVEFKLGEIEKLPLADHCADVIISNCVINLSPDKKSVFREAFRVLKPGGRLMVSDLVLVRNLPDVIKESIEAYVGCLAGAVMKDEYLSLITLAGFQDVRVVSQAHYSIEVMANDITAQVVKNNPRISSNDLEDTADAVASIKVSAVKPPAKGAKS